VIWCRRNRKNCRRKRREIRRGSAHHFGFVRKLRLSVLSFVYKGRKVRSLSQAINEVFGNPPRPIHGERDFPHWDRGKPHDAHLISCFFGSTVFLCLSSSLSSSSRPSQSLEYIIGVHVLQSWRRALVSPRSRMRPP
jgi:hypothetical protein